MLTADSNSHDFERVLLDNLELVDRVCGALCRLTGLDAADADDFTSWVHMRLVDDDYALLRKFRGASSITTYLTVVVASLMRDYRTQLWGRWRPSAVARRSGEVGTRLEVLLYRKGLPLTEAIQTIRASDPTISERSLAELAAKLPQRTPRHGVQTISREALAVPDEPRPSEPPAHLEQALRAALDALPPEDALIVRLRFWQNNSVSDIARTLNVSQKPLYRRIERIQAKLRDALTEAGITSEQAAELLELVSSK